MLDLVTQQNNQNSRVIVTGSGVSIAGWLAEEFSFSTTSNYSESESGEVVGMINKAVSEARIWSNALGSSGHIPLLTGKEAIGQTFLGMSLVWGGGQNIQFEVPILLVAVKESDDLSATIKQVQMLTNPKIDWYGGGWGAILTAPLGYTRSKNPLSFTGTVALRIGNWFKTPAYFVVTGATVRASTAVLKSGKPLYAMISLTFKSVRVLSVDEVQGFII